MLLAAVMEQMHRWQVVNVGIDCALPAPGCYGIPDAMPHVRTLIAEAGFGGPARGEMVLAARCEDLVRLDLADDNVIRTVGTLGTRFTLSADKTADGYIEVCQPGTDLTRSSLAAHWADVGNLILADDADPAVVIPILLSCAARWLLLGGVIRLMDYWIIDVDSPNYVEALQQAGFVILGRNDRGFTRSG